ncbi:unnamed protein product [Prorocentrum cordatum]|uniref:Uncharacterized protein n=1 Tax=Prorocentrum cordatum TaxID=2364126 RepID=A0ABN9Y1I5_9DINO|nr:unnamed protein product [Polarella glacialis]
MNVLMIVLIMLFVFFLGSHLPPATRRLLHTILPATLIRFFVSFITAPLLTTERLFLDIVIVKQIFLDIGIGIELAIFLHIGIRARFLPVRVLLGIALVKRISLDIVIDVLILLRRIFLDIVIISVLAIFPYLLRTLEVLPSSLVLNGLLKDVLVVPN